MTFAASMRLGSLEILAALAVFGLVGSRLRSTAPPKPKSLAVAMEVRGDAGLGTASEISVPLGEGVPAVIGRSPDAQVQVADPEVSRRHARLEFVSGVVYLADLGSSNGTFLNGKSLKDEGIELRPGDDIDVGNTRITVLSMGPSE